MLRALLLPPLLLSCRRALLLRRRGLALLLTLCALLALRTRRGALRTREALQVVVCERTDAAAAERAGSRAVAVVEPALALPVRAVLVEATKMRALLLLLLLLLLLVLLGRELLPERAVRALLRLSCGRRGCVEVRRLGLSEVRRRSTESLLSLSRLRLLLRDWGGVLLLLGLDLLEVRREAMLAVRRVVCLTLRLLYLVARQ